MSKKARRHLARDPVLKEILATTPLPRRRSSGDVYSELLRTIIYQQLAGRAAAAIHARFLGLFGEGYPHAKKLLRLTIEQLCGAGLSRQKASYLRNVAEYWREHQLHTHAWDVMVDDEVVDLLTEIKGVGEWSAQMILMFTLDRPDVFPVKDLGIRNAIVRNYRLRSKGKSLEQRMLKIAAPWRPYRTLACRYLWRSVD